VLALSLEESTGGTARPLHRVPLVGLGAHDEKWLQALLFAHPAIIPIDVIDPGAGAVIPICRELPIPKDGSTVYLYLDLLGVTRQGRLVLVECKLWRNPQARREVIAQILEYAALLRQWTYADLTARLKSVLHWTGENPLFEHVRQEIHLDEARFVDAVSYSLSAGDFDLIVAGDGIRSDLQAITTHLNAQSGILARLALVEFQVWSDGAERTVVVPNIPLRTEVIQQRVIVGGDGLPLRLEAVSSDPAEEAVAAADPAAAQQRNINRQFWDRFIERARFDHPDQPPPRHGGNNWVRLELPSPAKWMAGYRTKDKAGVFITLNDDAGREAFETLEADRTNLETEIGLPVDFKREGDAPFKAQIGVSRALLPATGGDEELLEWLTRTTNKAVSAFRPRLAALSRQ
jgi:hypothetical protein